MNYQKKLKEAKKQVKTYFEQYADDRLSYHNLGHTQNVVAASLEIAAHMTLSDEDLFALTISAWFHDTGYVTGSLKHEEKGSELARKFLFEAHVAEPVIDKVVQAILATRSPQSPVSEIDKILCDADLFHLGTGEFLKENKWLKKECEALEGLPVSNLDWFEKDLDFLSKHRFHTVYAQETLTAAKEHNINVIREKIKTEKAVILQEEAKKEKSERPERGIETMFRVTSSNNQRLSDMADNKAHILITVNSIILTAIISLLLRKLEENSYLIIPTIIMLGFCLAAMIFSILATRPAIPHGRFTPREMEEKTVNLLFFGNFYEMHLEEYSDGMFQVMKDHDFLYGMLIRDVFGQGVVLGKKYRLLRIAYNIFMYGFIVAVAAYIIATLLRPAAIPVTPLIIKPAQ